MNFKHYEPNENVHIGCINGDTKKQIFPTLKAVARLSINTSVRLGMVKAGAIGRLYFPPVGRGVSSSETCFLRKTKRYKKWMRNENQIMQTMLFNSYVNFLVENKDRPKSIKKTLPFE